MFGIIVTGHGGFATGIETTLDFIMGKQAKTKFIDFFGGMTAEILSEKFEKLVQDLEQDGEVLVLTDIKGGTPFNAGVLLSQKYKKIKVIGGLNMPMLIEALDIRDDNKLEDSIVQIIESAKNEIEAFQFKKMDEVSGDGI